MPLACGGGKQVAWVQTGAENHFHYGGNRKSYAAHGGRKTLKRSEDAKQGCLAAVRQPVVTFKVL